LWGTYTDNGEPKGILHTTETSGFTPHGTKYGGWHTSYPHFTVVMLTNGTVLVYQHIPVNRAARALKNLAGGVQTNLDRIVQVEIVWRAAAGGQMPTALLDALRRLMRWVEYVTGVPRRAVDSFHHYPPENGARLGREPWRMSGPEFDAFSGWLGHQHAPENCVHPDTPILCADLTWRPAGGLQVGDELIAFDEETEKIGNANGGRRYRKSVVTQNRPAVKDSYRLITTQGEVVASADHPWLVRLPYVNRGSRIAWVKTSNLDTEKHRIISTGDLWEAEDSRMAGWMAGVLDADGHAFAGGRHGSWVGFGQVDGEVLDLFLAECDRRSYTTKVIRRDWTKRKALSENPKDFTDVRILGGMWKTLEVLGTLRPARLLAKGQRMWEGAVIGKTTGDVAILSVESVGKQPVASLTTSTSTYIASGLLCHNTHGDPGKINIKYLLDVPILRPLEEPMFFAYTPAPVWPNGRVTFGEVNASGIVTIHNDVSALDKAKPQWFKGDLRTTPLALGGHIIGATALGSPEDGYRLYAADGGVFTFQ